MLMFLFFEHFVDYIQFLDWIFFLRNHLKPKAHRFCQADDKLFARIQR
jgi:hypothetical protein